MSRSWLETCRDLVIGGFALAAVTYTVLPRRSAARELEAAGRAHAALILAALGPRRCYSSYRVCPEDDRRCVLVDEHGGLHVNRAGFAWDEADIAWLDAVNPS